MRASHTCAGAVAGAYANPSQQLADLTCDSLKIGNHHLWFAGEARTQQFVLGSNAYGTRVQMALPRHYAAHCQQRSRAKPEFIGPEQSRNYDISSELQSAIHPQADVVAKSALHQCAMRVAQAQLPGQSGILD